MLTTLLLLVMEGSRPLLLVTTVGEAVESRSLPPPAKFDVVRGDEDDLDSPPIPDIS